MELARVYIAPQYVESVLVPSSWSNWTCDGIAFRRNAVGVQQKVAGWWMPADTVPERWWLRDAKVVVLRVIPSEMCASLVGTRRALEALGRVPNHQALGGRSSG